MYLKDKSNYVDGLVNMASSCFTNMGPSSIIGLCFDKDNYLDDFSEFYEIKKESIKISKVDKSFHEVFTDIFLDDYDVLDGLKYWLEKELGNINKIYIEDDDCKLNNLLSSSEGGLSGFYTVEDVIIIEFKKYIVVLIIGNNE